MHHHHRGRAVSLQTLYDTRGCAAGLFGSSQPGLPDSSCAPANMLTPGRRRGRGGWHCDGVRSLQPGDNPRNINWKASARTGQLKVCRFLRENTCCTLFLLDLSAGMFFSSSVFCKSELALKTLALAGWHASDAGQKTGAVVLTEDGVHTIRPGHGEQHFKKLLEKVITLYRSAARQRVAFSNREHFFGSGLHGLNRLITGHTHIWLLSDFTTLNACAVPHLRALGCGNQVTAVRVSDPLETGVLPRGVFPVSDGVSTAIINCSTGVTRDAFAQGCRQQDRRIRGYLQVTSGSFIAMNTSADAKTHLSQLYHGAPESLS